MTPEDQQRSLCAKYGISWVEAKGGLKVGIARNVVDGLKPINGLRHPIEGDTTGWYIWAGEGEPDLDPDFFVPLHVEHLSTWCREAIPFLGLPPGWRFLVAPGYEDAWEDPQLLNA